MTSKLKAAQICFENVEMYIVNGNQNNFVENALTGNIPCTHFQKVTTLPLVEPNKNLLIALFSEF
jgi:glutamate 5-kinase